MSNFSVVSIKSLRQTRKERNGRIAFSCRILRAGQPCARSVQFTIQRTLEYPSNFTLSHEKTHRGSTCYNSGPQLGVVALI